MPVAISFSSWAQVLRLLHSGAMALNRWSDDVDEDADDKAKLYTSMRQHILKLAGGDLLITWPVNKYFAPLCVDPAVILGATKLGDVTWHDVPERRWNLLTAEEHSNLQRDVWFYSRTGLREEAARAATALADELNEERAALTDAVGLSFAYDLDEGEGPSEQEVEAWLSGRVQMSLHDWVSFNRKELQARARERIHEFLDGCKGTVPVAQRKELELMLTPAAASTIAQVETSLGDFQRELAAARFGSESGASTGQAVVAAALGKETGVASSGQAVVHIPFGEDIASHLEKVHKDALRWVLCQRKMGLLSLMAAPTSVNPGDEFAHYRDHVMKDWAFPDLTPKDDKLKAVWVNRAEQLLSKLPKHTDGEHAQWLNTPEESTGQGQRFNSIDAILRRHNGEIKVMDVPRWIQWEEATPYPADAEWRWRDGAWHYGYPRRTCFTLAEVLQYYPGNASDLYLWYCHNGEVLRPAKKTTQSVKAAAEFKGRLTMKGPARSWLHEMAIQVPKDFQERFGRCLKRGLSPEIMAQAREQVSTAIQSALRDTSNRTVNLNVYMKARPYQHPAADFNRLTWAVMHDERLIMLLSDPSLPAEFVADVRRVYIEQGWPEGVNASDDKAFAAAVDLGGNLTATMTYACSRCAVASSAVTGWDYKPKTGKREHRWGCKVCAVNWEPHTNVSVVVHVRSRDRSFSFFSRWPLSYHAQTAWPEVYHKTTHFAVVRSTWYCKYDPNPELRDVPPSDDPRLRVKVTDEIQRAIWNILLPDAAFASDEATLRSAIRDENSLRWKAYGPGSHGRDEAAALETYRAMRVHGHVGGADAPEYEAYCKAQKKQKKQKKQMASYVEPWVVK